MTEHKGQSTRISNILNNEFRPFSKEEIETTLPARFEAQVRRNPERLAVKLAEEALTYGALNAAANRIAHGILTARGKELEPVALLLDQSVAAVASILGTLRRVRFTLPWSPTPATRS